MEQFKLPQTFLIMAFRYALNRNTSAPWEVSKYIKKYWKDIDSEFKRQIKGDIERQIRCSEDATHWVDQTSEEWFKLLEWIELNEQRVR